MYDNTSNSSLRNKYLGSSSSGGYPRSSENDYILDNLEQEGIYKKKATRLELEILELRKENELIKNSNSQLKSSEALRNSRMQSLDQEKHFSLQHERDDLMRDVTDLARGNRLLSQENDILSQKYSNLLDVYNKIILNDNSASKLADVYSSQVEGRSRVLKDYTKDKWEEFSGLNQEYEQNKRKMNEMYATLKGKLMHVQTDSKINYDTKEQWRGYAEDVQQVFDQVFRLSQEQSDLHQKIIINQSAKNRELQQKLELANSSIPKNGAQNLNEFNQKDMSNIASNLINNQNITQNGKRNNGLTSIQESNSEESRTLNNNAYLPVPDKKTSNNKQEKEQSTKRPKTASATPSEIRKITGSTLKKSTSSIKPKMGESKTQISSPSKTKLLSASKTNLGVTKKAGLSKVASITSIQGLEGGSKLTKSKLTSPTNTNKMNSSVAPKINVLGVPK